VPSSGKSDDAGHSLFIHGNIKIFLLSQSGAIPSFAGTPVGHSRGQGL
jgi:hypothetical protein